MPIHRYPSYYRRSREKAESYSVLMQELKAVPCMDCGNSFPPECMDFDHVRGEKFRNVSLMINYGRDRVLAEIAKCDIVCANCHRIRTHARRGRD